MKIKLIEEKVYSKILDKDFAKNIETSPVWKDCIHSSDITAGFVGYIYTVMFDGTKPVQVKGIKKV